MNCYCGHDQAAHPVRPCGHMPCDLCTCVLSVPRRETEEEYEQARAVLAAVGVTLVGGRREAPEDLRPRDPPSPATCPVCGA